MLASTLLTSNSIWRNALSRAPIKPCPSTFASEAGRRRRGREAVPQRTRRPSRGRALRPRDAPEQGEEPVGDEEEEGERGLEGGRGAHVLDHAEHRDGVTEEEGQPAPPVR